jgi:hypothetical protein
MRAMFASLSGGVVALGECGGYFANHWTQDQVVGGDREVIGER